MMSATTKAVWDSMVTESKAKGEHNDCTVKALTAATGLPYDQCHAALKKLGRKNRRGCNWMTMGPLAAKALGFNLDRLDFSEYNAKTMITAARDRRLQAGNFVVQVSRHVAAMVDGKVIDWSEGRAKRIQCIYECTPIAGYQAPVFDRGTIPAGSADWQSYRKYKKQDNYNLFD